jgi:hypothetical protein
MAISFGTKMQTRSTCISYLMSHDQSIGALVPFTCSLYNYDTQSSLKRAGYLLTQRLTINNDKQVDCIFL